MRQAGRYLPEYRALRERHDFLTSCRTPELACEITLQPVRRLGVDAAILFSDILVPLPGMGVDVAFNPGPQLARTIRDGRRRAPPARAGSRASRPASCSTPSGCCGASSRARCRSSASPARRSRWRPTSSRAARSKSFAAIKGLLFGEPRHGATGCCAICTDTVAAYLAAQVEAGAQAAMLFDTWAGLLAPSDVAATVAAYACGEVVEAVRRRGRTRGVPTVPLIYYAGEAARLARGLPRHRAPT